MSTPSDREAALRRALLSAAEHIEPAPGGFERIQERLGRPRPVLVAWLEAAWTVLLMRAPDVIEAVRRRAAEMTRLVWDRFSPKSVPGPGPQRLSWLRWLRPLAAMSVAVFVIGAGVYIGLVHPPIIFDQATSNGLGTSGNAGTHPGGPGLRGSGGPLGSGSQSAYPPAANSSRSPSTCKKSPTAQFKAPPSSSPGQSTPPATSTSPITSPPPSSSPPVSTTPGASSPATSENSAGVPNAGLASGNPAASGTGINGKPSTTHSVRRGAGSTNASQAAAQSPATTGSSRPSNKNQQYNPCSKTKRKKAKTGQLTSVQLAGGSAAAKLD